MISQVCIDSVQMLRGHANPDSKLHRANMGPIWGRQDLGGPHVGLMNFVIWECAASPGANKTTLKDMVKFGT